MGESLPFMTADQAVPEVLTATRLRQSMQQTPAAVTIIDRQMIQQSGIREIPEILRMVPGMVVGYESGSDAFVSYHGTSADYARRMQVLVDGRSIYQTALAAVDWLGMPIDINDIERIEVIRGPNSAAWGANSFLGVINIITRHPSDVPDVNISYRKGENGIDDYFARVAGGNDVLAWKLAVSGREDEGFGRNMRRDGETFDSKDIDAINGRAVATINSQSVIDFSFGMAETSAQQHRRNDPSLYRELPIADIENQFVSAAWTFDVSPENQFKAQASHSSYKRHEPWKVQLPPALLTQELGALYQQDRDYADYVVNQISRGRTPNMPTDPTTQARYADLMTTLQADPALMQMMAFETNQHLDESRTTIEASNTWQASDAWRLVAGVGWDNAVASSQTYLGQRREKDSYRVFAHGEWQMHEQWLLNLGATQEFDKAAGDEFSPRAALNWQFATGNVLRFVISEAVRKPDLLELYGVYRYTASAANDTDPQYGGDYYQVQYFKNPETERILSREISYFGDFPQHALTLDVRGFYDRLELVEARISLDNFQIKPKETHDYRGVEASVNWRPVASQRIQLNYAHLDMTGDKNNTDFVPKHSGSVGWWQDYRSGWQFGTIYNFYRNLNDDLYFDQLNAKLSKRFELKGSHYIEVAAVLQHRLTSDAELRRENGAPRHKGWLAIDWRY